ncbi:MAG: N-acetylneuraminate synthase family protein [Phycisphaerales bacterium]|nr:N-acetylneuraminate synthase family protein [Phycisphaerales bacterium]
MMRIGDRTIGPDAPPYIIAEIGVNHDGAVTRADELIHAAADAGADAVKFQMFEADRLLSRASTLARYQVDAGEDDPFGMLRGLELSIAALEGRVHVAHAAGLHAIVTVFSVELVDATARLGWDAFKTASPDLVHRPLLEALVGTRRPLFVSTGAGSLDEVSRAAGWIGAHPCVFLHCVSAYPTPEDEAALNGRAAMARVEPRALGYSDHTACEDTGALAVASGTRVLEKHLTHDRAAPGPDHAASLEPDAFARYVALAHRAWRMVGPVEKRVRSIEADVRAVARQSIVTRHALRAGASIEASDVTFKRPGGGFEPHELATLIGRRLRADVEADARLGAEHLE